MKEPSQGPRTLFAAALEIDGHLQRTAFLTQACGSDHRLLREVEELLEAHGKAGQFLPEIPTTSEVPVALTAVADALGLDEATLENTPPEHPGDRIGRFRLLQRIGEGGCGVVYMAEQEEPVRRRVALKVIKLGMDTKSVIARFEAERQALALMDHPNIAKVHDGGATSAGRPFFVMELVRGVKITQYCDEQKLSTKERLDLFIQVCQAVQHAHQKGVIHRDLKPSNILITERDGVPVPKVIDFGIAKATGDQRLTDKTLFTAFEQFIGTPAYMSPEQARLGELDIDTRSDVYSLGVLLYELLTGRTPFETKSLLALGLDEMRRTIQEKEPPRPSTRLQAVPETERTTAAHCRRTDPPKLVNLLKGDLDWIVMKCLEKDRRRRYETANGVALDLRRFLCNEPVLASPPGKFYCLQKMIRRNRLAVSASLIVVLSLVFGLSAALLGLGKARRAEASERIQRTEAERSRNATEAALYRARLSENHALRLACPPGWSDLMFQNLRSNAAMPASQIDLVELRSEAVAAMEQPDVRETSRLSRLKGAIWSLDFSSDGRMLAMSDTYGSSLVWDLVEHTKKWVREDPNAAGGEAPDPANAPSPAIRFSPAQDCIAYSTWNHSVEVGSLLSRTPQVRIGALAPAQNIVFDASGATLVVAWADSRVVAYRPETGATLREIRPAGELAGTGRFPVAISQDGRKVALGGKDYSIELYDLDSNSPALILGRHSGPITSLNFSPLGNEVVSTSLDRTAKIINIYNRKETILLGHKARVQAASFRRGGTILATASDDETVRLWDATTGRTILVIHPGIGPVLSVAFTPDGRQLAAASSETVLYDLTNEGATQVLNGHTYFVSSLAFRPGRPFLASASGDNTILLWNLGTGDFETRLPGHPMGQPWGLAFSPDGKWLAAGHNGYVNYQPSDHGIRVWDVDTRRIHCTVGNHAASALCVAFDQAGKLLASGDLEGRATVSEMPRGSILQSWVEVGDPVLALGFVPPGPLLVVARASGHIRLLDCRTGELVAETTVSGRLTGFAISPRFDRAVALTEAGKVNLLLLPQMTLSRTWDSGYRKETGAVAFSSDERLLALGGQDCQVTIWDSKSGRKLLSLPRQESPINALAFEPAGARLAVGGVELQITVWDLGEISERLHELGLGWTLGFPRRSEKSPGRTSL